MSSFKSDHDLYPFHLAVEHVDTTSRSVAKVRFFESGILAFWKRRIQFKLAPRFRSSYRWRTASSITTSPRSWSGKFRFSRPINYSRITRSDDVCTSKARILLWISISGVNGHYYLEAERVSSGFENNCGQDDPSCWKNSFWKARANICLHHGDNCDAALHPCPSERARWGRLYNRYLRWARIKGVHRNGRYICIGNLCDNMQRFVCMTN